MTSMEGLVVVKEENRGEQLCHFVNDSSFADVVLLVGPSRRPFYAHRVVLAATCPYFRTMFTSVMKESRAEEISLPDIDEDMFQIMLGYLYSGQLQIPAENVLPLLALADRFQCEALCSQLIQDIERNMSKIMNSPDFLLLPPGLVITLIRSDRLHIDELELFRGLIRWGEKQAELKLEYEGKAAEDTPMDGHSEEMIFYSREEHDQYKHHQEMRRTKSMERNELTHIIKELVRPLMEYVRFPLIEGRDLTAVVEPSGLAPQELLFEAYRYKADPSLAEEQQLPHHRAVPRNSVFCSFAGCKRKAVYACCNKKKDGYEAGCSYYSCELHTFHCSANCRKVGRTCEGILHHCDRNKGFCGPIHEFGRDRKNSI